MAPEDEFALFLEYVSGGSLLTRGDRDLAGFRPVMRLGPLFVDLLHLFVPQDELVVDRIRVPDHETDLGSFLEGERGRIESRMLDRDRNGFLRRAGTTGTRDQQQPQRADDHPDPQGAAHDQNRSEGSRASRAALCSDRAGSTVERSYVRSRAASLIRDR